MTNLKKQINMAKFFRPTHLVAIFFSEKKCDTKNAYWIFTALVEKN